MRNRPVERRSLLYRLLQVLALAHVGLYFLLTIDWLLHPLEAAAGLGNPLPPLARALFVLLLAPMNMVIGVLVLRKTRGSIIGLLLIIWSGSLLLFSAQQDLSFAVRIITSFRLWFMPVFLLAIFFPNGRAPMRGVELYVSASVILNLVTGATGLAAEPTLEQFGSPEVNPFYLPIAQTLWPLVDQAWTLFNLSYPLLIMLVLVAPIIHYRRGSPTERAQIKWFALFAAQIGVVGLLWVLGAMFYGGDWETAPPEISNSLNLAWMGYVGIFPAVPVGFGILRHRLYDIDIIIRRTLIYGVLTALLAGVYFGGVALAQALLRPFTGAGNDLAIVVTTLGIAALALPLRRAVQRFIDRRFFRRKYDTAKTLAAFSAHARDEVELEALTTRLVAVVDETMRPAAMSLWLREPAKALVGKEHAG